MLIVVLRTRALFIWTIKKLLWPRRLHRKVLVIIIIVQGSKERGFFPSTFMIKYSLKHVKYIQNVFVSKLACTRID